MRRALIACATAAILLGVHAPMARSEGINLSWDDCGDFGVENKAFACDANNAVFTLVASFIRDAADSAYTIGGTLAFDAGPVAFPDWWRFPDNSPFSNPPGPCQDSGNFVHDDGQTTSCPTIIVDPETIGSYAWLVFGPNTALFNFSSATTSLTEAFVSPGTEYSYLRLILKPTRTTGPGACAGCGTPMTITLTRAVLVRDFIGGNYEINEPATRNVVTWEGPPTPVLPATWGMVKRLYRR